MKQFEADLIDALALDLLTGIIVVTVGEYYREHPGELEGSWHLQPRQDVSAIRHILEAVNVPTLKEFFGTFVGKRFMPQMSRTVCTLCVTAFDSFLERHGGSGTLGNKLGWLKQTFRIPQELEDNMCELISRRNDVAHNNALVSRKYANPAGLYKNLLNSSWVAVNGMAQVGEQHVFNADYEFWMLDQMWKIAKIVCP
jgi:hypothetical protein